ncbi:hypothetical protein Tco_1185127 [Tanacetum coccineum]
MEQLVESDKGVDVNADEAKEQGVDSLNPTFLASKIHDIKFQMLQGKLTLVSDGAKFTSNRDVSYANLLNGEPRKKIVNFRTLVAPFGIGADVAISLLPFSSWDIMDAMLENVPRLIRNVLLILKKWSPNSNLLKEDLSNVLFGLNSMMFLLLRSSYAKAMIDLRVDVELKKTLVVAIPKIMAPRIVHMGIRKKGVVGTLGLRIRTRGDTMSGVENGTITVVEVIIGDGSGRKWAGVGRLEWLEWLIIGKGRLE